MVLAGQTDVALRTLTTLLGILSAALVYRVTVDMSRQPAAGLAAAIVLSSMGFASYYIHETHNYILMMTESAALLLFYHRWQEHPRRRDALGIVVTELLLIYTNYASIYLLLAFNLHACWLDSADTPLARAPNDRRAVLRALAARTAMGHDLELRDNRSTQCRGQQHPENWSTAPALMQSMLYDGWVYYAALIIIGLIASLVRPVQSRPQVIRAVGLLLFVAGASLLFALAGNTIVQTLSPRRMIYLLPFVAVLLGYGSPTCRIGCGGSFWRSSSS